MVAGRLPRLRGAGSRRGGRGRSGNGLGGARRCPARRAAAGAIHALFLGHDRAAQGRQAAPARNRRRARATSARGAGGDGGGYAGGWEHGLSLARAALSRRPARLVHHGASTRRDRGGDEAFRPGTRAGGDRAVPRHRQPVGADAFRPDAQAPRGRPVRLRPLKSAPRHPRRRALPGAGQARDDRVVGAGDRGILRRVRGHRHDADQVGGLAGAPGKRGQGDLRQAARVRAGWHGGARR